MKVLLGRAFEVVNLGVSLAAVASIAWYHGFSYRPGRMAEHGSYLYASLGFYLALFLVRGLRSSRLSAHLQQNALETSLWLGLLAAMAVNHVTGSGIASLLAPVTGTDPSHAWVLVLHLSLLVAVGAELARIVAVGTAVVRLSAAKLFVASFAVLIIVGAVLLMLPEMTVGAERLSFEDALFTSTSAACVTGLTVVDTATRFSFKGQLLLLALIQLGGLNIVFFATFFIARYAQADTLESDAAVSELLHADTLTRSATRRMMKRVVATAILIELAGSLAIYTSTRGTGGDAFASLFHAVSAFNNAGFSVSPGGLENAAFSSNRGAQAAIASLIIIGGLGFNTLWELRRPRNLSLGSRISLFGAAVLIPAGAVLLFVLESGRMGGGQPMPDIVADAAFHSVSARTAGFSVSEIGELGGPALAVLMVWMFVGASTGSTGGGIKTSTTAVLLAALGRRLGLIRNPRLSWPPLVKKALTIVGVSLLTIASATVALMVTEPDIDGVAALFEATSAFATVGLSTGITPSLSPPGKAVVMLTMFIGRVGPLALAYALVGRRVEREADCCGPEMMIG